MHFPIPEIRHFDKISVYGTHKKHKEKIPYTGINSRSRWNTINNILYKKTTQYISNKVKPTNKMNNELEIHTVYWTSDRKSDQQFILPE